MSPTLKTTRPAKQTPLFAPDFPLLETLEARIAPAGLDGVNWQAATFGTPILLGAGQGLSTSTGDGGTWLLHVEKGQALIFLTDLNGDGQVNVNEITGISAGDGLRLTSFVDINGDIVTNLNPNGKLTDLNASAPGNDGRVVLGSKIEGITLRSLTEADTANYEARTAATTYSIYGNIFAGGGFGVAGGGLIIDTANAADPALGELYPSIGMIVTGTAVSGQSFSFGVSGQSTDVRGVLGQYSPAAGKAGGDIIGIKVGDNARNSTIDPETGESTFEPVEFQIGGLWAGDGGAGARGGDIRDVTIFGDVSSFFAYAGRGGNGSTGGHGGSIVNLSDLGSTIAFVDIATGDGGTGFNGKGGNGGTLSFGEFSTTGAVTITLGDGGNGTLGGGHGAGLSTANLTPIDLDGTVISPVKVVTTYRQAGDIGTPTQIDFNGDGIGDMVYIAQDPNMLVVKLGVMEVNNTGIWYGITDQSPTFYLAAPIYGEDTSSALAVGEFNGRLGIVTASSAEGSHDGIYTFLWNDDTGRFDAPLRSAIPLWANRFAGGGTITDLVVGDFTGDGETDIAFLGEYYFSKVTDEQKVSDLVVLTGTGEGYFYSNSKLDGGYDNVSSVISGKNAHTEVILQATGNKGSLTDVVLVATPEIPEGGGAVLASYAFDGGELGSAWTVQGKFQERSVESGTIVYGKAEAVDVLDFGVTDIDGDGYFDVISLNTDGVVIAFKGNVDGKFEQVANGSETYAAFQMTGALGVMGGDTEDLNDSFKGLVIGNFDGDPAVANFALYSVSSDDKQPLGFYEFDITGFVQNYVAGESKGDVTKEGETFFLKPDELDEEVVVFASYEGKIASNLAAGFVIGSPYSGEDRSEARLRVGGGDSVAERTLRYTSIGFAFEAGDGGDSQLGLGGSGGGFGNGVLKMASEGGASAMPEAGFTISIPLGGNGFSANFSFNAGDGGSGFTGGGAGGSIAGMAARYTGEGLLASGVMLSGGDGGASVQGAGGKGGSLSKLSVETLWFGQGGDGGRGATGGAGGSILGNGISGLYDTLDISVTMWAGAGGDGNKGGGKGGDVSGFRAGFLKPESGYGGSVNYVAGQGGNAVAGRGGDGGSIIGSNPLDQFNLLVGPIFLTAGDGGNGLAGGHGGSISNFINKPSIPEGYIPTVLSFMAGDGGSGVTQNGGNGGSITNVRVAGTGVGLDDLEFNRFLAGQGGDSFGAAGGNGGNISGLNVSAASSSLAIAAGGGGDGMTKGGVGGNVLSTEGTAKGITAGQSTKVLVVAGEGGDAYGFKAASTSLQNVLKAFGGIDSVGGNGGNISGFKSSGTAVVTDLIAGNGGSLINYGSSLDKKTNVGKGGSISNIALAGNAGDVRSDQLIKSYVAPGEKMSDFVANWLGGYSQGVLDNSVGNVGVVAGAAGRVAGDNPASKGVNGSVTGFAANEIMSMVAGSVDRIAGILTLSGVTIKGSVFGAYKNDPLYPHTSSNPLYLVEAGSPATTETANPGGALIDGAILVKNNKSTISSIRVFSS